ncbi:MAG TPA: hypothetical protein VGK73_29320 [Polyangiaceae bacterium]
MAKSIGTITSVSAVGVSCGGVHFDPDDPVFGSLEEAEAAARKRNYAPPRVPQDVPSSPEN